MLLRVYSIVLHKTIMLISRIELTLFCQLKEYFVPVSLFSEQLSKHQTNFADRYNEAFIFRLHSFLTVGTCTVLNWYSF